MPKNSSRGVKTKDVDKVLQGRKLPKRLHLLSHLEKRKVKN